MTVEDITRLLRIKYIRQYFTRPVRLQFYESMAVMLRNDLPIRSAFEAVKQIYTEVSPRSMVNNVYNAIWKELREGRSFAECLAPWIPDGEYLMIRAVSDGGEIRGVLDTVVLVQSQLSSLISQVGRALFMPVVYLIGLVLTVIAVGKYLMPFMHKILPPMGPTSKGPPPPSGIENYVNHGLAPTLVLSFVAIALIVWSLPRLTGPVRVVLDKLPGYGIYRAFAGAEFLLTLSGYLKENIPVQSALERIQATTTGYRNWHVNQMLAALRNGREIGDAMRTGLFSKELEIKFMSYARHMQAGEFTVMIERVATDAIREVTIKTVKFANIFGVLSKAVIMLAVAWVAMMLLNSVFASMSSFTGVH